MGIARRERAGAAAERSAVELVQDRTAQMQFVERSPWISTIHAEFYIGVDGISMPLILLTTFTTLLIVIASWQNVAKRWRNTWRPF